MMRPAFKICALVFGPSILSAFPSVYPTGTTIYKPEKAWNGYTVHPNPEGAILIDMNGNVVKQWKGLDGGGGAGPYRILPGGFAMGSRGARGAPHQDVIELVELDWYGSLIWKFDRYEELRDPGKEAIWTARQHHDYQRDGNPVGYYVPGMDPLVNQGHTLILSHKNLRNPKIYVSPFFSTPSDPRFKPTQQIYRAYRVPYGWVPQLPKPVEKAVIPPDNSKFRINP